MEGGDAVGIVGHQAQVGRGCPGGRPGGSVELCCIWAVVEHGLLLPQICLVLVVILVKARARQPAGSRRLVSRVGRLEYLRLRTPG